MSSITRLTAIALCSALAVTCSGVPDDVPSTAPAARAQETTLPGGQGRESVHAAGLEKTETSLNREAERDADYFALIVLPDTQGYADVRHKRPRSTGRALVISVPVSWRKPNGSRRTGRK